MAGARTPFQKNKGVFWRERAHEREFLAIFCGIENGGVAVNPIRPALPTDMAYHLVRWTFP